MAAQHKKYSANVLALFTLVQNVQDSEQKSEEAHQKALQDIALFLKPFRKDEIDEMRGLTLDLAEEVLEGKEMIVTGVSNMRGTPFRTSFHPIAPGYAQGDSSVERLTKKNKQDVFLRARASRLQSNMSVPEIMVVLRGLNKPARPEISFYDKGMRPEDSANAYFSFRNNVYVMKYPDGDDSRNEPAGIDFVCKQNEFEEQKPKRSAQGLLCSSLEL